MTVFVWSDASPVDGCALADFTVQAESLKDAARLAQTVPWSRCRTAKKLREVGLVRVASEGEHLPSQAVAGIVFWESETGWQRVP